jgi:hypothetical protein
MNARLELSQLTIGSRGRKLCAAYRFSRRTAKEGDAEMLGILEMTKRICLGSKRFSRAYN